MRKITIKPCGWLKEYLELQMNGLTGNIEAAGYPFNSIWWGNPEHDNRDISNDKCWWPFEQTAYWLDGFTRCAVLLDDKQAIKRAQDIIYSVIDNADNDGYIGPHFMKECHIRWSLVVFFRACMALYEYNSDNKIISAMSDHFLKNKHDYSLQNREILVVEMLVWLFEKTDNKRFIELAEDYFDRFNQRGGEVYAKPILSRRKMNVHGVTYNEFAKLGALLYKHTHNKMHLKISQKAIEKLERYYMLPTQCNSSSERLLTNMYWDSQETCDICDLSYALENILASTDEPKYADKIEKCVFNAGIGAVTEDFKGLQYFSCANQIISDYQSNHNAYYVGGTHMSYGTKTGTECCVGNINRMMPNYIMSMYRAKKNDVFVDLFGPSKLEFNGVSIIQKTDYPFNNRIDFHIETDKEIVLHIRKPQWAKSYRISGAISRATNGYIKINVNKNTDFHIVFTDEIKLVNVKDGAYVIKGALVYSLGMKGTRVPYKTSTVNGIDFHSYSIMPDKPFNYAFDERLNAKYHEAANTKWEIGNKSPYIDVDAHVVHNWIIKPQSRVYGCDWTYNKRWIGQKHTFTPKIPQNPDIDSSIKRIRLYPLGMSKLRMTVLPVKSSTKSAVGHVTKSGKS